MKKASKCNSLSELKEYIDNEKPRTDIGIVEIDKVCYEDDDEEEMEPIGIEVPISQNMRSYLFDWCDDLLGDSDAAYFSIDDAMLNDLQYIAEHSQIPFDWKALRKTINEYKDQDMSIHLILY